MRTITKEVFTINELSEEARENAFDAFRSYDRILGDQSDEISTVRTIAEVMGWECDWDSYDGISYRVSYYAGIDCANLSGSRAMAYIQNNFISTAEQPKTYWLDHVLHCDGRKNWKRKSKINYTIDDCPFTGFCMDYCFAEAWKEWKKNFSKNSTVQDFADMVADKLADEWTAENEYRISDEGLTEFIECNDYEFLEDGTIYIG